MNTTIIQAPEGCREVSHLGVPYPLDDSRRFEVPEDIAFNFLRLPGFAVVEPDPKPVAAKRAAPKQEV